MASRRPASISRPSPVRLSVIGQLLDQALEQLDLIGVEVVLVHLGVGRNQIENLVLGHGVVDRPAATTLTRLAKAEPSLAHPAGAFAPLAAPRVGGDLVFHRDDVRIRRAELGQALQIAGVGLGANDLHGGETTPIAYPWEEKLRQWRSFSSF